MSYWMQSDTPRESSETSMTPRIWGQEAAMRRLWMLGALLAAGLAVGACSSEDDGDDNDNDDGNGYSDDGTGRVDGDQTGTLATDGDGTGTDDGTGTGTGSTTGGTTVGGDTVTTGGVALSAPDPRYGLSVWPAEGAGFEECTAEMQIPEPYNVVLMFVVDVSGSMTQAAPVRKAGTLPICSDSTILIWYGYSAPLQGWSIRYLLPCHAPRRVSTLAYAFIVNSLQILGKLICRHLPR